MCISYHTESSTILIAGTYFYDKKNGDRTYYRYYQAFNHTKDNKFKMKYNGSSIFSNPAHGKYVKNYLRSWTRIIAHPYNKHYFYLLGINNLTAYNVTNGKFIWTAKIPSCSIKYKNDPNRRPLIYNDATFFASGMYVTNGGTHYFVFCVDIFNIYFITVLF